MAVDTHCHVAANWYEPVEALLAQMDRCGVEEAWLVQMLGVYENRYQQAARAAYPGRFASIVGIDWTLDGAVEDLARLTDGGAAGVRLRPGSRSPGDDPLAIWRAAEDRGLVVSCVGTVAQVTDPGFAALLGELPRLTVVIEHFGGLGRPDAGDVDAVKGAVFALASHPAVHLKLPGLGQLLPRAALETPPARLALIDEGIAAFGADRLMWGSDFPVVSSREGYANALGWARAAVPEAARDAIFGHTARRIIAKRQ